MTRADWTHCAGCGGPTSIFDIESDLRRAGALTAGSDEFDAIGEVLEGRPEACARCGRPSRAAVVLALLGSDEGPGDSGPV